MTDESRWHTTSTRLWKALSPQDRADAAHGVVDDQTPLVRHTIAAVIAQARNMRPQSALKLPKEAQARILATVRDPGEMLAASLLVALHLGSRREMLCRFLDAASLPHENGILAEKAPTDVSKEAMDRAVASLAQEPRAKATCYINTLILQDPERWAGLSAYEPNQIGSADPSPASSGSTSQ